ncbi:hypothetical protein Y695_02920 [Hydrogenophaga sp. T4]|nr:hypothetical protein Y695_02920 [Hydrogenophaga sp. T4]
MNTRAQGACGIEEVRDVRARDGHAAEQHHGCDRDPQFPKALAQPAAIEGLRQQGAPATRCAGTQGVVVGPVRNQLVAHMAARQHVVQHPGCVLDERAGLGFIEELTSFFLHVGQGVLGRVLQAGLPGQAVAGNPDHPRGVGRGAAEHRLFFRHDDIQPAVRRGESRRQTGGAGAGNQHITLDLFHACGLVGHQRPISWAMMLRWISLAPPPTGPMRESRKKRCMSCSIM